MNADTLPLRVRATIRALREHHREHRESAESPGCSFCKLWSAWCTQQIDAIDELLSQAVTEDEIASLPVVVDEDAHAEAAYQQARDDLAQRAAATRAEFEERIAARGRSFAESLDKLVGPPPPGALRGVRKLDVLRLEIKEGRGTEENMHRIVVYYLDAETGDVIARHDPTEGTDG